MQLYIAANGVEGKQFERQLYVIRKRSTHDLRYDKSLSQRKIFYICSLSPSIIIYKGMLNAMQVKTFYLDLQDTDYASHIAMVHSRFSTNTFPSWDRAQPNRYMSHNGEINTLLGNRNWMTARQGVVKSDDFDCDIEQLFPIAENDCSDSGNFDNVLEFLLMSGRSLQHAVMMMVPEAWQSDKNMDQAKKDFYRFNSTMMEPWDGPASIAFTDGHYIGALLDRNGLRPSRYYLTKDDRVIMASEVGVVDVDPADVKFKGRLQPGKMFLIDFDKGELISDEVLKKDFSTQRPYGEWLNNQEIRLSDLGCEKEPHGFNPETIIPRMQAFGYTVETMQFMLLPLVRELRDPVGSMGNDSALACLSDKPRMIYDYFKQLFAQVTNPAIDSIREEVVMSLECYIGPEGNLLEITEQNAHRLRVPHPILTNEELACLKHIDTRGWKAKTIDITYDKAEGTAGLGKRLDEICDEARAAIRDGYSLIVLSDRAISAQRVPVSTLLATGAVHHHLVDNQERTRIGIVLETGEAREVHHHCLLIGYGADAINPYVAFEALFQSQREGLLDNDKFDDDKIVAAYRKGVAKGMLKVMAKIGISTLHSYKGAQIFEAYAELILKLLLFHLFSTQTVMTQVKVFVTASIR
jgi:glutamate synthase (NADPH/NADH) large chain